jgi:Amt family ammonium transporter
MDSGDSAWMLTSTALVLLMTMPGTTRAPFVVHVSRTIVVLHVLFLTSATGLAIYYSGMTREKHVLAIAMQVFTICCVTTVLWMIFGYSLAFSPTMVGNNNTAKYAVYGSGERLWLLGLGLDSVHQLAPTIPEGLFCAYELMFAIITAALICGSFADRMKYVPMVVFISLWHLAVYCPLAHSNWHPSGFLYALGVLDYAGGNVVHISSGVSGLATVLVIGNRHGFDTPSFAEPHNILLTYMGMSLLWVGWFGFNAGSAFGANPRAAFAMLATQIATSTAALTWMLVEWAVRKKQSVLGMISGAVAGLVCITPAAGYVDMTGAFFIGFFGGPLCYLGAQLKHYLGYDDALDAFGVHAIGGIVGGIANGFFATDQVNPFPAPTPFQYNWAVKNKATTTDPSGYAAPDGNTYLYGPFMPPKGVYYGNTVVGGYLLASQLCGICFAVGWSFAWTYVICKLVDVTLGLRVSEADELEGLDTSIHGEVAMTKSSTTYRVDLPPLDTPESSVGGNPTIDAGNGKVVPTDNANNA